MLELLPGTHVVSVSCSSRNEDDVDELDHFSLRILAEAGHKYELRGYPPKIVEVGPGKKCWNF